MKQWQAADNYMGEDYTDYFVLLARTRDSDILENSNFETALKELGGESEPAVIVARASHWAYGWIEFIGIYKDALEKIETGEEIENELSRYPVLSENDYCARENAYARDNWKYLSDQEKKELKREHNIKTRSNDYAKVMHEDQGGLYEYLTADC